MYALSFLPQRLCKFGVHLRECHSDIYSDNLNILNNAYVHINCCYVNIVNIRCCYVNINSLL